MRNTLGRYYEYMLCTSDEKKEWDEAFNFSQYWITEKALFTRTLLNTQLWCPDEVDPGSAITNDLNPAIQRRNYMKRNMRHRRIVAQLEMIKRREKAEAENGN